MLSGLPVMAQKARYEARKGQKGGGVIFGRLWEGQTNIPIADGIVALLTKDEKEIIAFAHTQPGGSKDSGKFSLYGVPEGEYLLVGFHPKYKTNLGVGIVEVKGQHFTKYALTTKTVVQDTVPASESGLGLLLAVGREVNTALANKRAEKLTAEVIAKVEPDEHKRLSEKGQQGRFKHVPSTPPPVKAGYRVATKKDVNKIMSAFGSIPGGITLQGKAKGIGRIKKVFYDSSEKRLMLNNKWVYEPPIHIKDTAAIFRSIAKNGDLGISLSSQSSRWAIVYGAMDIKEDVISNMVIADNFLGHITYAYRGLPWLQGYNLAKGYMPQKEKAKSVYSGVTFIFNGYRFRKRGRRVVLSASKFLTVMVPLLVNKKGQDGGHLPDLKALKNSRMSKEHLANVSHLSKNFSYYMRERFMRVVHGYGEVAAFGRTLKDSGIDLNALANQMEN